jgi:hypothetical protein
MCDLPISLKEKYDLLPIARKPQGDHVSGPVTGSVGAQ